MINPLSTISAVILAGGQGTRLADTLPDIPKALAEINGRPFVRILLDRLEYFGIRHALLCTGHLGRLIRETLGDRHGALRLVYSQEETPLGTAGALSHARGLLLSDPVLVLNGDSYCHSDLKKFFAWFQDNPADAAIVLTRVEDARRYGRVEIDASGTIMAFNEKTADEGPGLINAGIYLIRHKILETIPRQAACSMEKDIFPALAGDRLAGFTTHDAFIDIGTGDSYRRAPTFFASLEGRP
jgi:D-glycero-alpha-D-manno-heptose 1-phosphate guanylyltransferase